MQRTAYRKIPQKRRGVVIVFTAVTILTLLLFASLAVDVGYICALTAEQQNTADAGALAGANLLQEGNSNTAEESVFDIISRNQRTQGYHSLSDQIVQIGKWNSVTRRFTELDPSEWENAFAVRVRAAHNQAPLFFAGLMGKHSTDVWRQAVAVGSKPCGGIWGLNGVRVPGNVLTDSYDSTAGSYDSDDAGDEGDLCSGRAIEVMGSVEIDGDLMSGFGYPVRVRGDAAEITGITTSNTNAIDAPLLEFGDIRFNNDNDTIGMTDDGQDPFSGGWNLRIGSHDNLTVAPGRYYFDSMIFRAAATLTITGPTEFYVRGDIDASGEGKINTSENPADLMIYSAGSVVTMTGEVEFYGSILAPFADVRLGGTSAYYGAIIGGTVTIFGDFEFHVDESSPLTDLIQPPPPMLVQ